MPHAANDFVIGPTGSKLTVGDLPPPGTMHWVDRRKVEVVAAVQGGLISFEQARSRYMLSVEEFISWQKLEFGRPHLISSDSGLQYVRRGIFDAIERVRTDFKANLHAEKPV